MDNCGECCETFGILYCGCSVEGLELLRKEGIEECPIVHAMLFRGRKVEIPFKDRFDVPLAEGTKTRTWRTRKFGNDYDWFERKGHRFIITKVERACMGTVPEYFQAEGFKDKEDAIQTLKEIFPANGYQPDRMGWAHWFKRIDGQDREVSGD